MIALYITSMGEAAGKSALCAALGKIFKARGWKVGYLKPVAVVAEKVVVVDEPSRALGEADSMADAPLDGRVDEHATGGGPGLDAYGAAREPAP